MPIYLRQSYKGSRLKSRKKQFSAIHASAPKRSLRTCDRLATIAKKASFRCYAGNTKIIIVAAASTVISHGPTIDPINQMTPLRFRQFLLRGLDAARGEWSLVTMARNIRKMAALRNLAGV